MKNLIKTVLTTSMLFVGASLQSMQREEPIVTTKAEQADRKIVQAENRDGQILLSRFNPDGTLDETFGVSGMVTLAIGNDPIVKAIRVQPDGKILIQGTVDGRPFKAQFIASGMLDTTYETFGIEMAE
jgi:hypothetical protein